jgi:MoaA/NifB/PqqE/SkfB family radical SAM enzyme
MRQSARFERSTMATDTALNAIARAAAAGVNAVTFTGGEPLLDVTQISRYVRYARQRGIPITRTGTNGYLFAGSDTRRAAAQTGRVADVLASAGLQTLSIGLDSADAATHDATRGLPGVVAGIERALPVFHEAGLYPTAHLSMTRTPGGRVLPH